jgi:hypothetical protein
VFTFSIFVLLFTDSSENMAFYVVNGQVLYLYYGFSDRFDRDARDNGLTALLPDIPFLLSCSPA